MHNLPEILLAIGSLTASEKSELFETLVDFTYEDMGPTQRCARASKGLQLASDMYAQQATEDAAAYAANMAARATCTCCATKAEHEKFLADLEDARKRGTVAE